MKKNLRPRVGPLYFYVYNVAVAYQFPHHLAQPEIPIGAKDRDLVDAAWNPHLGKYRYWKVCVINRDFLGTFFSWNSYCSNLVSYWSYIFHIKNEFHQYKRF